MKVLVYGAGVIGCYLAHVLNQTQHDVALLARGEWKSHLEANGLTIQHYLQRKQTVDQIRIVNDAHDDYDVIFVAMQYNQMLTVLEDVAKSSAKTIVLVGNNLNCQQMKTTIDQASPTTKTVLFAFSNSGGRRENNVVYSIHVGAGGMTIGPCKGEPHDEDQLMLNRLFARSKYKLTWTHDMYAWCRYHLAFILPVCYLAYQHRCNLRRSSIDDRRHVLDATYEAYTMLKQLGTPEPSKGEASWYRHGSRKRFFIMNPMFNIICATKLGELAATDHCKNAVPEMHALSDAWDELRKQVPDLKMPNWDALKTAMPAWDKIELD